MRWFTNFDNKLNLYWERATRSCLTASFELTVENEIATLSDSALKLYVKGTEDVNALLKPCHWTKIATKSSYHKTGMSEKACKPRLKQTSTNPTCLLWCGRGVQWTRCTANQNMWLNDATGNRSVAHFCAWRNGQCCMKVHLRKFHLES